MNVMNEIQITILTIITKTQPKKQISTSNPYLPQLLSKQCLCKC